VSSDALPDLPSFGLPQLFAGMAIVLTIWWWARSRSGPGGWF
jgi:hypothetical protein